MKRETRGLIIAFCGIGFIIIGGGIIKTWAINPLVEVEQWIQNPTCNDLLICHPPKFIYFEGKDPSGNIVTTMTGKIDFSSRGQFAINSPIYYEIKITAKNPEFVKNIYFVISTKNEDHTSQIESNPDKFFDDMKRKSRLIDMQKISDNDFYRKGLWTIDIPAEQVFVVFVVSPNGNVDLIDTSDVLFTLVSPELKTQDNANIESRIANKQILGLTWMGIGLGFALLGADFIARVVLRETD